MDDPIQGINPKQILRRFVLLLLLGGGPAAELAADDSLVFVFRENRQQIWTLWNVSQSRHLEYRSRLQLKDVTFEVNEEKRQDVIRRGAKRPHAGVRGRRIRVTGRQDHEYWLEIEYNPFRMNWSCEKESGRPVQEAREILFDGDGRVYVRGPKYFSKTYRWLNSEGNIYLSPTKADYGGHLRLKIFGRLDCRSALSWIRRGHYVKYRIFSSEIEFQKAGFRPCKVCTKKDQRK